MSDAILADFLAATDPVVVFERAFHLAPHDWQVDFLRETRSTLLLKGRQVGASLSAAALAITMATYRANSLSAIISPSLKQSTEITTRARTGLRNLGTPLVQDSASLIRLANGSRILSLPGSPRSVRGWSADLLVLDEAAYLEHATVVAARALVAATGGRVLVQSTPAGEHGDFHDMFVNPDEGWARFTVRSDSVATISAEFLASERRAMTPDAYAAEYECQFGRAGASLFSADRIASLILPQASR